MKKILAVAAFVLIVVFLLKVLWRAAIALLFIGVGYLIYTNFIAD